VGDARPKGTWQIGLTLAVAGDHYATQDVHRLEPAVPEEQFRTPRR